MIPLAPAKFSGRTLVVFGAGYVGGTIARQAAAAGLRVIALTRNPVKAAALATAGVETVIADLADSDWHSRVPADGVDFVLNCVASGGGGLDGYRRGYVDGLRSILAWGACGAAPGHLVYTGSTSVYPQGDGARVDESCEPVAASPDDAAGLLRTAEKLALDWPGRATVLRLAGIYGPDRHHLLDQLRTAPATLPGNGEHRLNLIHRDDIAGGCWSAWSTGEPAAGGVFNLADDGAATRAELVEWLATRLGVPVPAFTGETAPGRRRVTPDRVIVNAQARTTLGWRPLYATFREGYAALLTP